MTVRTLTSRLSRGAAALLLTAALAGCGGSDTPGDRVPAIQDALDGVDDALVDEDFREARSELDALLEATREGRLDGELDEGEAAAIIDSAQALRAAIRQYQADQQQPEPEPSEEPTTEEPEPEPTTEEPEPTEEPTTEEPAPEPTDELPTEVPTESSAPPDEDD